MLRLSIHRREELRFLANIFKKYASVFKLDGLGRRIPLGTDPSKFKENVDAKGKRLYADGSWEVPLLTFQTPRKPRSFRDFLMVSSFLITVSADRNSYGVVQVIVKSKKDLFKAYLASKGFEKDRNYVVEKSFALRTFVENYLEM